jgi:CelD/BcsL family acetyltransferase involved in cellulose biosynthesis
MRLDVLSPSDLSADRLARWSALQEADPDLASPFFRPEYAVALADVRDDVRVAVIDDGEQAQGFFAFHPGRAGVGRPAGARLSDYQGMVLAPGIGVDPVGLLARCGLNAWLFDHVPDAQRQFGPHATVSADSPVIRMPDGFDAYRRSGGSVGRQLSQIRRRRKQLVREVGEPTFELHSDDPADLDWLMRSKSAHYDRLGTADRFAVPWIVGFMRRLLAEREAGFQALLSVLRVGDRTLAAHLGLRSGGTHHWWVPTFDLEFSRYSPGLILLMEMAIELGDQGVDTIDFGRGDERYKERLANDRIGLQQGVVARPTPVGATVKAAVAAKDRLRDSALKERLAVLRDTPHRVRAQLRGTAT